MTKLKHIICVMNRIQHIHQQIPKMLLAQTKNLYRSNQFSTSLWTHLLYENKKKEAKLISICNSNQTIILYYLCFICPFKIKWKRRKSFKNTHEPSLCFTSKTFWTTNTQYTLLLFYFIEQSKYIYIVTYVQLLTLFSENQVYYFCVVPSFKIILCVCNVDDIFYF